MWSTWRKREPEWRTNLADLAQGSSARIRRLTNAFGTEPVVPSRGRYAAVSVWVENLAPEADLLDLEILIGGARAHTSAISPPFAGSGLQRMDARFPDLEQTGLIMVELNWFGRRLGEPATLRVIPPGPIVPQVVGVSGSASRLNGITVSLEELARVDEFSATIDDRAVWGIEAVCTDPDALSYDINFQLPDDTSAGVHKVQLSVGRRKLPPLSVELA